ncbi:hypothetical protein DNTS_001485 [Danionella cerebrum]|uniref:Uncharacterized protein n=1 Tax=Danionella cerebrum TaxID=2873325 RepID=A0A553N503_9TELE|nr:hypothetical protein DNTS_001485 [Danionella translucida]
MDPGDKQKHVDEHTARAMTTSLFHEGVGGSSYSTVAKSDKRCSTSQTESNRRTYRNRTEEMGSKCELLKRGTPEELVHDYVRILTSEQGERIEHTQHSGVNNGVNGLLESLWVEIYYGMLLCVAHQLLHNSELKPNMTPTLLEEPVLIVSTCCAPVPAVYLRPSFQEHLQGKETMPTLPIIRTAGVSGRTSSLCSEILGHTSILVTHQWPASPLSHLYGRISTSKGLLSAYRLPPGTLRVLFLLLPSNPLSMVIFGRKYNKLPQSLLGQDVICDYRNLSQLILVPPLPNTSAMSIVCVPLSSGEDSCEMQTVEMELEAVEKQIRDLFVKQAQLRERKAAHGSVDASQKHMYIIRLFLILNPWWYNGEKSRALDSPSAQGQPSKDLDLGIELNWGQSYNGLGQMLLAAEKINQGWMTHCGHSKEIYLDFLFQEHADASLVSDVDGEHFFSTDGGVDLSIGQTSRHITQQQAHHLSSPDQSCRRGLQAGFKLRGVVHPSPENILAAEIVSSDDREDRVTPLFSHELQCLFEMRAGRILGHLWAPPVHFSTPSQGHFGNLVMIGGHPHTWDAFTSSTSEDESSDMSGIVKCLDQDGGFLIQLMGTAARSGHFDDAFLLGNYRDESVAPLDLLCHIGCASLSGDASCLHNSFQDHDDFQVAALQLHRREVIERTVLVDDVADDQRRTAALMIMLLRKSPTRIMKHSLLLRTAMTACRLKMRVSARRCDCAVFMKIQPSITALMIKPMMFCNMRKAMAAGHCSVIIRPPKPIVTCTSMENRKAEVKELKQSKGIHDRVNKSKQQSYCSSQATHLTLVTHCSTTILRCGSRSPCAKATSHQDMAKSNQLHKKVMVKMTSVKRHFRSTSVVKTSCKKRPCSRMFLCAKLQAPLLAMKRALFTRSLNTGLRGTRDTSAGRANSSGMMLFRGSITEQA